MARPTKHNADYFSHDCGMRNDPKIRALRKKFSNGYAVYCMLLEVMTSTDYFTLEIDEIQLEILAGDFDTDPETLQEIITFCVKIKLLIQEKSSIYSFGLKHRLQPVIDNRNAVKQRFLDKKLKESGVSKTQNTQSKVKYTKVKESRDNNKNYYPSTAGAEGAGEKIYLKNSNQDFEEKEAADFEEKIQIIPIDELEFPQEEFEIAWRELKTQRFFELIQMQHEKDVQKIEEYFKKFYQEKWAENKLQTYPNKLEFFKNFFRWIPYHKSIVKQQANTENNGITNTDNRQFTRKTSNANEARASRDQLDAITNAILLGAQA